MTLMSVLESGGGSNAMHGWCHEPKPSRWLGGDGKDDDCIDDDDVNEYDDIQKQFVMTMRIIYPLLTSVHF